MAASAQVATAGLFSVCLAETTTGQKKVVLETSTWVPRRWRYHALGWRGRWKRSIACGRSWPVRYSSFRCSVGRYSISPFVPDLSGYDPIVLQLLLNVVCFGAC